MKHIKATGCGFSLNGAHTIEEAENNIWYYGAAYKCSGTESLNPAFRHTTITVGGNLYDNYYNLPQKIKGFIMTLSPVIAMDKTISSVEPTVPETDCVNNFNLTETGSIDYYNLYGDTKLYVSIDGHTYGGTAGMWDQEYTVEDSVTGTTAYELNPGALEPMIDTSFPPVGNDIIDFNGLQNTGGFVINRLNNAWRSMITNRINDLYLRKSGTGFMDWSGINGLANLMNEDEQESECPNFRITLNTGNLHRVTDTSISPSVTFYATDAWMVNNKVDGSLPENYQVDSRTQRPDDDDVRALVEGDVRWGNTRFYDVTDGDIYVNGELVEVEALSAIQRVTDNGFEVYLEISEKTGGGYEAALMAIEPGSLDLMYRQAGNFYIFVGAVSRIVADAKNTGDFSPGRAYTLFKITQGDCITDVTLPSESEESEEYLGPYRLAFNEGSGTFQVLGSVTDIEGTVSYAGRIYRCGVDPVWGNKATSLGLGDIYAHVKEDNSIVYNNTEAYAEIVEGTTTAAAVDNYTVRIGRVEAEQGASTVSLPYYDGSDSIAYVNVAVSAATVGYVVNAGGATVTDVSIVGASGSVVGTSEETHEITISDSYIVRAITVRLDDPAGTEITVDIPYTHKVLQYHTGDIYIDCQEIPDPSGPISEYEYDGPFKLDYNKGDIRVIGTSTDYDPGAAEGYKSKAGRIYHCGVFESWADRGSGLAPGEIFAHVVGGSVTYDGNQDFVPISGETVESYNVRLGRVDISSLSSVDIPVGEDVVSVPIGSIAVGYVVPEDAEEGDPTNMVTGVTYVSGTGDATTTPKGTIASITLQTGGPIKVTEATVSQYHTGDIYIDVQEITGGTAEYEYNGPFKVSRDFASMDEGDEDDKVYTFDVTGIGEPEDTEDVKHAGWIYLDGVAAYEPESVYQQEQTDNESTFVYAHIGLKVSGESYSVVACRFSDSYTPDSDAVNESGEDKTYIVRLARLSENGAEQIHYGDIYIDSQQIPDAPVIPEAYNGPFKLKYINGSVTVTGTSTDSATESGNSVAKAGRIYKCGEFSGWAAEGAGIAPGEVYAHVKSDNTVVYDNSQKLTEDNKTVDCYTVRLGSISTSAKGQIEVPVGNSIATVSVSGLIVGSTVSVTGETATNTVTGIAYVTGSTQQEIASITFEQGGTIEVTSGTVNQYHTGDIYIDCQDLPYYKGPFKVEIVGGTVKVTGPDTEDNKTKAGRVYIDGVWDGTYVAEKTLESAASTQDVFAHVYLNRTDNGYTYANCEFDQVETATPQYGKDVYTVRLAKVVSIPEAESDAEPDVIQIHYGDIYIDTDLASADIHDAYSYQGPFKLAYQEDGTFSVINGGEITGNTAGDLYYNGHFVAGQPIYTSEDAVEAGTVIYAQIKNGSDVSYETSQSNDADVYNVRLGKVVKNPAPTYVVIDGRTVSLADIAGTTIGGATVTSVVTTGETTIVNYEYSEGETVVGGSVTAAPTYTAYQYHYGDLYVTDSIDYYNGPFKVELSGETAYTPAFEGTSPNLYTGRVIWIQGNSASTQYEPVPVKDDLPVSDGTVVYAHVRFKAGTVTETLQTYDYIDTDINTSTSPTADVAEGTTVGKVYTFRLAEINGGTNTSDETYLSGVTQIQHGDIYLGDVSEPIKLAAVSDYNGPFALHVNGDVLCDICPEEVIDQSTVSIAGYYSINGTGYTPIASEQVKFTGTTTHVFLNVRPGERTAIETEECDTPDCYSIWIGDITGATDTTVQGSTEATYGGATGVRQYQYGNIHVDGRWS